MISVNIECYHILGMISYLRFTEIVPHIYRPLIKYFVLFIVYIFVIRGFGLLFTVLKDLDFSLRTWF